MTNTQLARWMRTVAEDARWRLQRCEEGTALPGASIMHTAVTISVSKREIDYLFAAAGRLPDDPAAFNMLEFVVFGEQGHPLNALRDRGESCRYG